MDKLRVSGGQRLSGRVAIAGAKNAALPLMAAGLVTDGTLRLTNVPDLVDTRSMEVLLRNHGLDDLALLDLNNMVAYYNYINRVVMGMGIRSVMDTTHEATRALPGSRDHDSHDS